MKITKRSRSDRRVFLEFDTTNHYAVLKENRLELYELYVYPGMDPIWEGPSRAEGFTRALQALVALEVLTDFAETLLGEFHNGSE